MHDNIVSVGSEVFVIRTGQKGIVHAAQNLGSKHGERGTFRTACVRRFRVGPRLTVWRGRVALKFWDDDDCNRCPACVRMFA